jgi:excisionase family DNA binding protein
MTVKRERKAGAVRMLYSITSVAEMLDASVDSVRRLVARRELAAVRLGEASLRIAHEDLVAYVAGLRRDHAA